MTKEELLELGLTEEQIPGVFKINGIDVEKAKGDLETKEIELKTLQGQLDIANEQIEDFKDLDIEGIKKASEDYKVKFEDAEKKAKEDIANLKFEHELEGAIRDSKAKNVKAVKALLDMETLKGSNNQREDVKQALEQIQADNDYLFEIEDKQTPPNFTRPFNSNKDDKDESLGERLARQNLENK